MQVHTLERWDRLGYEGRHAYLADATPAQVHEQASVIARAARRGVGEILTAWIALGLLGIDAAAEALASGDAREIGR